MEAKSVWLSKTLWVNTIATIAMLVQYYTGFVIDPEMELAILAGINTLLRLITRQPVTWASGSDGGFIRWGVLSGLLFVAALFLSASGLSGCATIETPQSLAAKSLLTTRQGVIVAAGAIDDLCSQGVLRQTDCDNAAVMYTQAQAAYATAVSAFLFYLQVSDSTSLQQFQDAQLALQTLFFDLDTLARSFQGGTGK